MPVLLAREAEFDAWLNGAPHLAFALAREYPPGQMRIVQVELNKRTGSRWPLATSPAGVGPDILVGKIVKAPNPASSQLGNPTILTRDQRRGTRPRTAQRSSFCQPKV
jgi:hypothetical protein